MASEVVRIDAALVEAAREIGETMGRSVAGQLSHWARLGRAVEGADIPTSAIQAVLARQASLDSLDPEGQAAVVELWDHQIARAIADLDLAGDFDSSGEAYAELDDDGNVVEVTRTPAADPGPPAKRKRPPLVQSTGRHKEAIARWWPKP